MTHVHILVHRNLVWNWRHWSRVLCSDIHHI